LWFDSVKEIENNSVIRNKRRKFSTWIGNVHISYSINNINVEMLYCETSLNGYIQKYWSVFSRNKLQTEVSEYRTPPNGGQHFNDRVFEIYMFHTTVMLHIRHGHTI